MLQYSPWSFNGVHLSCIDYHNVNDSILSTGEGGEGREEGGEGREEGGGGSCSYGYRWMNCNVISIIPVSSCTDSLESFICSNVGTSIEESLLVESWWFIRAPYWHCYYWYSKTLLEPPLWNIFVISVFFIVRVGWERGGGRIIVLKIVKCQMPMNKESFWMLLRWKSTVSLFEDHRSIFQSAFLSLSSSCLLLARCHQIFFRLFQRISRSVCVCVCALMLYVIPIRCTGQETWRHQLQFLSSSVSFKQLW